MVGGNNIFARSRSIAGCRRWLCYPRFINALAAGGVEPHNITVKRREP
jgi:hypothetical protein